ncbi:MAG: hypothetical protein OXE40_09935 [Gammaproteobacteria bacterium]|nr:hypothetical protein [Gammaproteobacteria bacterium]
MKGSAVPAQGAANAGIDSARGVAAGPRRGSFRGRRVSGVSGSPGAVSPRQRLRASATARATARLGGRCTVQAPTVRKMDAWLDALVRIENRPRIRECLEELGGTVRKAEAEFDGMQCLLMKSRECSLDAAEWRQIRGLTLQSILYMPMRQDRAHRLLDFLTQPGTFNRENTELLTGLMARLGDVWENLPIHLTAWLEAGTRSRVEATLPSKGGKRVAVERFVVSGRALGAHFVGGYPSPESFAGSGATRYSHLPGLSAVALTSAEDEALFSGLRHDLFPGADLNGKLLDRLTNKELRKVIKALVVRGDSEYTRTMQRRMAPAIFENLRPARASGRWLEVQSTALSNLRQSAHRLAVNDLATAAFVVRRSSGCEESVEDAARVKLFSIALLKPGDLELWRGQHNVLSRFGAVGDTEVQSEGGGQARRVQADCRQFAFCLGQDPAAQRLCRAVNRKAGLRLLGPLDSPEPGGDLKTHLDVTQATIRRNLKLRDKSQAGHRDLVERLGSTHWKSKSSYRSLCVLDQVIRRMERSVIALEKLDAQVKALRTPEGDWPSGAVAQRQVAARLALIGYEMGETAALSCAEGSDLVDRLESHISFLAAVADSAQGVPPEIDLDRRLWQPALAAFESPASPSGQGGELATGPAEVPDMPAGSSLNVPVILAGGRLVKSGFKVDLLQKVPAADQLSETSRGPIRSRTDGGRNPGVWLDQRPRRRPDVSGSDISDVQ